MGIVLKRSPIPYTEKRSALGQIDGQHVTVVKPSSLQLKKPETKEYFTPRPPTPQTREGR